MVVAAKVLSLVTELEVDTAVVEEDVGVVVVVGQSEKTVSLACQIVVRLEDKVVVVLNEVEGVTARVEREGMTVHRTQFSGNPAGTEICLLPTSSGDSSLALLMDLLPVPVLVLVLVLVLVVDRCRRRLLSLSSAS